jgi:hypothetical protein
MRVNEDKPLFLGNCVPLEISYSSLHSGSPVTDLQPYLGAAAHVTVVHESMEAASVTHTNGRAEAFKEVLDAHPTAYPCVSDVMVRRPFVGCTT